MAVCSFRMLRSNRADLVGEDDVPASGDDRATSRSFDPQTYALPRTRTMYWNIQRLLAYSPADLKNGSPPSEKLREMYGPLSYPLLVRMSSCFVTTVTNSS